MFTLPSDLYQKCRAIFHQCAEFESDNTIRTLFITIELAPFHDGLPEANTKTQRIDLILKYLLQKQLTDGRHVFPFFLMELSQHYSPTDKLHIEITNLAQEISEESIVPILSSSIILQQKNTLLPLNPFCDRGCIRNPQRFFNRKRLIRDLESMLPAGNCIALIGPSEIGKSSLLYYIYTDRENWQKDFTVLYLDMQRIRNEKDFCKELLRKLEIPDHGDLDEMKWVLLDHKIILLLDEIEKLQNPAFSTDLHGLLRSLAQEENFKLAVAAQKPLEQIFPPLDITSPFHNIFTERNIGPFTTEEAYEFLTLRLQNTEITFSPAETACIIGKSQNHPAKLQLLAGKLFDQKMGM